MSIKELNKDTIVKIKGINTFDWIPEIRTYGPVKKCSLKVSKLINIMNNGYDVNMDEDLQDSLYLFVKKYNMYLDSIKSDKPRATKCEEILYSKINKLSLKEYREEKSANPLTEDPNDNTDASVEKITSIENKPIIKKRKTMTKRIKAYDIIADKEVIKDDDLFDKLNDIKFNIDYT